MDLVVLLGGGLFLTVLHEGSDSLVMLTTAKPSPALAQQKPVNQADWWVCLICLKYCHEVLGPSVRNVCDTAIVHSDLCVCVSMRSHEAAT